MDEVVSVFLNERGEIVAHWSVIDGRLHLGASSLTLDDALRLRDWITETFRLK